MLKTENRLEVAGKIIAVRNGIIVVFVPGTRDAYIRVRVTKGTKYPKELKKQTYVKVTGYCRSYYAVEKKSASLEVRQFFVADEITLQETALESQFGVGGRFFGTQYCNYAISGIAISKKVENGWVRLTVITDMEHPNRTMSSVHLSLKATRQSVRIKKGDIVCIPCSVSTPKKEIDGKMKYFEDIMGIDVAIIGREEEEAEESKKAQAPKKKKPAEKAPKEKSVKAEDSKEEVVPTKPTEEIAKEAPADVMGATSEKTETSVETKDTPQTEAVPTEAPAQDEAQIPKEAAAAEEVPATEDVPTDPVVEGETETSAETAVPTEAEAVREEIPTEEAPATEIATESEAPAPTEETSPGAKEEAPAVQHSRFGNGVFRSRFQ